TAQVIYEARRERGVARPDAALTEGVDGLLRHASALRDTGEEEVVADLDLLAQPLALFVREGTVEAGCAGMPAASDLLGMRADSLEQGLEVDLAEEDADGTRERGGVGVDLVARRGDVVTAARRHA